MTINNDGLGDNVGDWLDELFANPLEQRQVLTQYIDDPSLHQIQGGAQDAPIPNHGYAHPPMPMHGTMNALTYPHPSPMATEFTPPPQPQLPQQPQQPQQPQSPYGALVSFITDSRSKTPLFDLLNEESQAEFVFRSILYNQQDVINGLHHERGFIFSIPPLFQNITVCFHKNQQPPPLDFFSNVLKYCFPDYTSGLNQNNYQSIIKNIVCKDMEKLEATLKDTSESRLNKTRIRRIMTTLACQFGYKPLIDYLMTNKLMLFTTCRSQDLKYNVFEWLCIANDTNTLTKLSNGGQSKYFQRYLKTSRILELAIEYERERVLQFCFDNGCEPNRDALLIKALAKGNERITKMVFQKSDLSCQKRWGDGASVLHIAVEKNDPKALECFLKKADPSLIDNQMINGKTALHLACENGFVEGVKLLVNNGASTTVSDKTGNTPLHLAIRSDSFEVLRNILEHQKTLLSFTLNSKGQSVFDIALEGQNHVFAPAKFFNLVHWLLKNPNHPSYEVGINQLYTTLKKQVQNGKDNLWLQDIDTNLKSKLTKGERAVLSSMIFNVICVHSSPEEIQQYLLNTPDLLPVNETFDKTTFPLHLLISRRCEMPASILINGGADTSVSNSDGLNALHLAILYENSQIVKTILRKAPELINSKDKLGLTPLHHACRMKSELMVKFLVECGADVKVKTNHGDTALHYVCSWHGNNTNTVKTLLEYGANPRLPNHSGLTPLYLACQFGGDLDLLKVLIENYASLCIPSRTGITPLHLLCMNQSSPTKKLESMIEMMVMNGANINAKDKNGLTPLFYALMTNCNPCLVGKLLELNADPTIPMTNGITPLHLICLHGKYKELAFELISRGVNPYVEDEGGLQPIHYAIHIFDWHRPILMSGLTINEVEISPEDIVVKVPAVLDSVDHITLKPWKVRSFTQSGDLVEGTYDGKEWSSTKPIKVSDIPQEILVPTMETLKTLLKSGLKITKPEVSLFKHIILCGDEELFSLAIKNLDISDKAELKSILSEALVFACNELSIKSMHVIREMINKGADINAQDENGLTWLHKECKKENNLEMIKTILHLGGNVNIPYPQETWKTPCFIILEKHSEEFGIVNLMMRAKANIDFKDYDGDTFLHHAVSRYLSEPSEEKLKLVITLIKLGANVNIQNKKGVMPIHLITRIQNESISKLLPQIISPFNVNIPDNQGVTPYHNACRYCTKHEIIEGLRTKYNADPTLLTKSNQSALHFLAMNESISVYDEGIISSNKQFLLLIDNDGNVPARLASRKGKWDLTSRLIQPIVDKVNERAKLYGATELGVDLSSPQSFQTSLSKTAGLLKSIPFIHDLYSPIIELACTFEWYHKIQTTIFPKLTKRNYDNIILNLKENGYKGIDIIEQILPVGMMPDHMTRYMNKESIPEAPDSVSVDDLQSMFESMNTAGRNQHKSELKYIEKFVSCIKKRTPVTGAPNKSKCPDDFYAFYNTLENLVKHVISHLKNKDYDTQKEYLLLIADKVTNCATRWNEEFTMLYNIFSDKPVAKTFFEQMMMSLQNLREGIILQAAGSNVHTRNQAKRLVGERLGIPTPTAYNDTTISTSDQEVQRRKNRYLNLFFDRYQPHRICFHLLNEISFIYNGMSSREMMLIWLRQNIPNSYKSDYYREIIREVLLMQKTQGDETIRKHLEQKYCIFTPSGQTFIEAIKNDRAAEFRESAFDLENTHRTTLTLPALIDILVDKKVLGRRAFQTDRKRPQTSEVQGADDNDSATSNKRQKLTNGSLLVE